VVIAAVQILLMLLLSHPTKNKMINYRHQPPKERIPEVTVEAQVCLQTTMMNLYIPTMGLL
jgi:hypothetical protein